MLLHKVESWHKTNTGTRSPHGEAHVDPPRFNAFQTGHVSWPTDDCDVMCFRAARPQYRYRYGNEMRPERKITGTWITGHRSKILNLYLWYLSESLPALVKSTGSGLISPCSRECTDCSSCQKSNLDGARYGLAKPGFHKRGLCP